jgi:hypothetical protein
MKTTVRRICLTILLSILVVGYSAAQCDYETPTNPFNVGNISSSGGSGWLYNGNFSAPSGGTPTWKLYSSGSTDMTLVAQIAPSKSACVYLLGGDTNPTTLLDVVYINGSWGELNVDLSSFGSYNTYFIEVHGGATSGYINIFTFI